MVIKAPQIKKMLENPMEAAEASNLVYITESKLTIKRHRHGKGFYFTEKDKKIVDKPSLARFKKLVIPPAWQNVTITAVPNGHLQVVGFDIKNRKQYRYHPNWSQIRNKTKFFKMIAFGKVLPLIREQVEKDLKQPKMNQQKCLALVLRLMEETHIRIGNDCYAKANKSYGLSTLRTKHLNIYKDKISFDFVGKKGKKHTVSVKNKKLQKLVLQCEEIPGYDLFQYYDEDGNHQSIDSGMVNEYIQNITGEHFSAKDFRTWAASKIFFETLSVLDEPGTKTAAKKNILEAFDAAANGLGNTRTVCKSYYIHPVLVEKYEDGSLKKSFKKLDSSEESLPFLSASEAVLLNILSEYKIEL